MSAIKYWCRNWYTFTQVGSQFQNFTIAEFFKVSTVNRVAHIIDFLQELANLGGFGLRFDHGVNFHAQTFSGHTHMSFKYLSHVHSRGNTQRVENDIYSVAILVVRHVFDRFDNRDDTFVTMTTSHLVTRLNTTLNREINLNSLQYTGRKIITTLQLAALLFETCIKVETAISQLRLCGGNLHRVVDLAGTHVERVADAVAAARWTTG